MTELHLVRANSSNTLSIPSQTTQRLVYSRENLLKYQNIQKADPTIQALFRAATGSQDEPKTLQKTKNPRTEERGSVLSSTSNSKWRNKGTSPTSPFSPTSFKNQYSRSEVKEQNSSEEKEKVLRPSGGFPTGQKDKENTKNNRNQLVSPTQNKQAIIPCSTPIRRVPFALEVDGSQANEDYSSPRSTPTSNSPVTPSRTSQNSLLVSASAERSPPSPTQLALSRNSSSPKIIDDHQLDQRQKQIDYGHQTLGYVRYRLLVPKEKRSRDDPRTPKKSQTCSKRSWDGQIKKWRRDLHKWDPEDLTTFMTWLESDFVVLIIKNNIGSEVLELMQKIKERALKFESTPDSSPDLSESSCSRIPDTEQDEKIARKLVF